MMNDNSLGGSGSSQNGGSMNYNHGNLQSSGNSNTHHNNHNSGGTLTTSFGSASGRDNHHQQQLQQQQLQQQYFQLQPITHTNNNPNEFLKNPNIFKRVYDELKQTPKPTHPIPPGKGKKFPLSKQNTAPIKLNLMDGHPPQVVCGAQLSIWHDTAGPGIEQFWSTGNENSMNLAPDFLTFIARQTLCGYDISMESEEMRFNIYPEQNVMIPSIIFNAKYHDKLTKLSLSIYLDLTKLSIYQHCHDFVSDRLSILASFILRNYSKNEYDLASFTSELINVCTNFENVFSAGYPHVEISQTFFMESTIPSPQDLDFLIRAISSHIITSGSTVVVGSKHNEILKWLDTLYMFLTPNERYISSRQVNSHEMIPDLMIQGLLNVNQKQIEEKLPFSLRPTTVIDIDKKEVYHTDILHQYTSFREDFLISIYIYQKNVKDTKILSPFIQPSSFIKQMLTEVFNLPICYRELYLVYYMRLLMRKASLAHSFIQSTANGGLNYQKILKSFMNLPFESDANLLFGIAEKIQLNLFMTAIRKDTIESAFAAFDAF